MIMRFIILNYLRSKHDFKEKADGCMKIEFIDKADMLLVLQFLYTDTWDKDKSHNYHSEPIVRFAHQYDVRNLLSVCQEHYMMTVGGSLYDDTFKLDVTGMDLNLN